MTEDHHDFGELSDIYYRNSMYIRYKFLMENGLYPAILPDGGPSSWRILVHDVQTPVLVMPVDRENLTVGLIKYFDGLSSAIDEYGYINIVGKFLDTRGYFYMDGSDSIYLAAPKLWYDECLKMSPDALFEGFDKYCEEMWFGTLEEFGPIRNMTRSYIDGLFWLSRFYDTAMSKGAREYL